MAFVEALVKLVEGEKQIYIQTHDYPDHDAVATAFGLQQLLEQKGIASFLIYEGEIQRSSLKEMISRLGINIQHCSAYPLTPNDKIIIVDGCKGNKNITDLIGDEIALVDHHLVDKPEDVPLTDIRPEIGSCSTIIQSYYFAGGNSMTREAATALMIGINMDTNLLTRGVSDEDIHAYSWLYQRADIALQNSILRNYIQTQDLNFYRFAIDHLELSQSLAWCFFPQGCNQNLLGILGDFFLALKEVDLVVLCAENEGKINFSVRNENPDWNAAEIIQNALKDLGFGGGHKEMAGGIIRETEKFSQNLIRRRICDTVGIKWSAPDSAEEDKL